MNLLRGAGLAGASGMGVCAAPGEKRLLRPLPMAARSDRALRESEPPGMESRTSRISIETLTATICAAGRSRSLRDIHAWRASLARAERHFARADGRANRMLRAFSINTQLRAPSEAKLATCCASCPVRGRRGVRIAHDGKELRVYRSQGS